MQNFILFFLVILVAALTPVFHGSSETKKSPKTQVQWETQFEGRALTPLALTENEKKFVRNFDGDIAKFSDGKRIITMKAINSLTRKVHPAADCFTSLGYKIEHITEDKSDIGWHTFYAINDKETLKVKEMVRDEHGKTWKEISAWYWAGTLGATKGPWMSYTIVEKLEN